MSNPNQLPNLIPYDENGNAVSVLWSFDPVSEKYIPATSENGRQVTSAGPRKPVYRIMHNAIISPDSVIPVAALGLFDFSGYSNVIIDIKLEGVGPYITLLPLYWNPVTMMYHTGQSQKFLSSLRVYADANGCNDIYFLPIEVQGTATVVVAGA